MEEQLLLLALYLRHHGEHVELLGGELLLFFHEVLELLLHCLVNLQGLHVDSPHLQEELVVLGEFRAHRRLALLLQGRHAAERLDLLFFSCEHRLRLRKAERDAVAPGVRIGPLSLQVAERGAQLLKAALQSLTLLEELLVFFVEVHERLLHLSKALLALREQWHRRELLLREGRGLLVVLLNKLRGALNLRLKDVLQLSLPALLGELCFPRLVAELLPGLDEGVQLREDARLAQGLELLPEQFPLGLELDDALVGLGDILHELHEFLVRALEVGLGYETLLLVHLEVPLFQMEALFHGGDLAFQRGFLAAQRVYLFRKRGALPLILRDVRSELCEFRFQPLERRRSFLDRESSSLPARAVASGHRARELGEVSLQGDHAGL